MIPDREACHNGDIVLKEGDIGFILMAKLNGMNMEKGNICWCGHKSSDHLEEFPRICEVLIEGVDCEDDEYYDCENFRRVV